MGKNRFLAATLLGAVVALAALPATPAGTVPLPPDIKIAAPDPDVPPQRAAYLGKWTGTWDGILPTVLVVERVTAGSAETIYAWGVAPRWKISSPGWVRTTGQFANGVLRLSLRLSDHRRHGDLPDASRRDPGRDLPVAGIQVARQDGPGERIRSPVRRQAGGRPGAPAERRAPASREVSSQR